MIRTPTITIGVLGSHSALDVCRGAKDEGFKTLVVAEKGREKSYTTYYKRTGEIGCVDECLVLNKFKDILSPQVQNELKEKNTVFVPHRSFEVYLDFDYEAIEKKFTVPVFGNRFLLKIEERERVQNQYALLKKAGIRYPKQFKNPRDIDQLCLVKVSEKVRSFERAFFLAENYNEYKKLSDERVRNGVFTATQLKKAVIEEFIVGVQVNLNFFYSPISKRLELMGTDTRRQTNFEGLTKIPITYQKDVLAKVSLKYEEAGHIAVTVLESMLDHIYELGEQFVKVTQQMYPPGIIGPFALQGIIIPGPSRKDIVVVDVSPRMPGSPGLSATPYSGYLFGESLSVGRRVAQEIKRAVSENKLKYIIT